MPLDMTSLIAQMREDGSMSRVISNPLAQFGPRNRRYLGAEILPNRLVPENKFEEADIAFRTIVAPAGAKYAPTQKREGDKVAGWEVSLGDVGIKREFKAQMYDMLRQQLMFNNDIEAVTRLINWFDTVITRAIIEQEEKQRWQALVDWEVERKGDGYTETVTYPMPTGHRVVPVDAWSDPDTDPLPDLLAMRDLVATEKGHALQRIVASGDVVSILGSNPKMRAHVGLQVFGQTVTVGGADIVSINATLARYQIPQVETYDLKFATETGTEHFLPRGTMVFIGASGRDETIDLGDDDPLTMMDVLGYSAIGIAAAQPGPGRVLRAWHKDDKPERIEAEGYEMFLPVPVVYDAWATLTGIT